MGGRRELRAHFLALLLPAFMLPGSALAVTCTQYGATYVAYFDGNADEAEFYVNYIQKDPCSCVPSESPVCGHITFRKSAGPIGAPKPAAATYAGEGTNEEAEKKSEKAPAKTPTSTVATSILEAAKAEAERARARAVKLRTQLTRLREQNQEAAASYRQRKANGGDLTGLTDRAGGAQAARKSARRESEITSRVDDPKLGGWKKAAQASASEPQRASDLSGTEGGPIDNPWVAYMNDTMRTRMVEGLRKSKSLRDEFRRRIDEMPDLLPADQESKRLLTQIVKEAEKAAELGSLAEGLTPLSPSEAFSMDEEETNRSIRLLLATLEENQFEAGLSQPHSLFERVRNAYARGARKGLLKN